MSITFWKRGSLLSLETREVQAIFLNQVRVRKRLKRNVFRILRQYMSAQNIQQLPDSLSHFIESAFPRKLME